MKHWLWQGGMALLDQGVFSGINFVVSVLLARWVLPSSYGVFSISMAVYQFAYQAHSALILEPMSVLGPSKMLHRLPDYMRDQIRLHFVVSLFGGIIISVIGGVVYVFNPNLGRVLIIMGLVLSFLLLPLLLRRGFYLFQMPEIAFLGSALYALIICILLSIINTLSDFYVELIFPVIGLAGLISGLYLLNRISTRKSSPIHLLATWSASWNFGKWLIYSSLLIALAVQVQTFVVGAFLGLSDAGAFRALQNFVQPMILFFTAICAILLPSLSRDFGEGNISTLKLKSKYLLILLFTVSVGYELLLLLYATRLEATIYNKNFSSYAYLIPLWGLVPIAGVLTYVYYFMLQSIQRPKAILIGSIVWSVINVILSITLSLKWGVVGATISVITGYLISGIVFAVLYRFYISKSESVKVHDQKSLSK